MMNSENLLLNFKRLLFFLVNLNIYTNIMITVTHVNEIAIGELVYSDS